MPKRNLILVLALLAAAVVVLIAMRKGGPLGGEDELAHLKVVASALRQIKDNFYHLEATPQTGQGEQTQPGPSDQELIEGAIAGMVGKCDDEYSQFLPDGQRLCDRLQGKAQGVGLKIEIDDSGVTIIGAVRGSSAYRARLARGMKLVSIDGAPMAGKTAAQVQALLDAPAGQKLGLVIRGGSDEKPCELVSEQLPVESVQGLYRDGGGQWVYQAGTGDCRIVYLRVSEFLPDTMEKIQAVVRSAGRIDAMVLDLRDNPGGDFKASREVADLFLRKGPIVSVRNRRPPAERFSAHDSGTLEDFRLAVLVNAATASGAEIVAGSLKLNDRAVVVGTRTRGKGCVQQVFKLEGDNKYAIAITVAEYFIGDDQPIARRPGSDAWGVDPHREVTVSDELSRQLNRLRIEIECCSPVQPSSATAPDDAACDIATTAAKYLELDPQIHCAIGLLRDPPKMQEVFEQARRQRQAAKEALHNEGKR